MKERFGFRSLIFVAVIAFFFAGTSWAKDFPGTSAGSDIVISDMAAAGPELVPAAVENGEGAFAEAMAICCDSTDPAHVISAYDTGKDTFEYKSVIRPPDLPLYAGVKKRAIDNSGQCHKTVMAAFKPDGKKILLC